MRKPVFQLFALLRNGFLEGLVRFAFDFIVATVVLIVFNAVKREIRNSRRNWSYVANFPISDRVLWNGSQQKKASCFALIVLFSPKEPLDSSSTTGILFVS